MSDSVIAVQVYTIRDFLKTPEDIASSLKKLKEIGYDWVQLSGLGPIDDNELKKMIDGEGLGVCSTHCKFITFRDEPQKIIDFNLLIGSKYPAGGMVTEMANAEAIKEYAALANKNGKEFAKHGLTFCYHNHSWELADFGGKTGLEMVYEQTDPDYLQAEIDTYWIQHGGGDPAWWIRKLSGRMPVVHFKDMGITVEREQLFMPVGEGNLNWQSIIAACKEAGVKWYIVEQDRCQVDPFESLKISLENMKQMGLK